MVGTVSAALALAVLAPVSAGAATQAKRLAPHARSLTAPGSLGSFTPASSDPRLAAAFARSGFAGGAFRFTPSSTSGGRRQVTVAIRASALTKAEAEKTALATAPAITPTAYNLGVSVGWRRFALSGDVAKVDLGLTPGSREAADVAFSYLGRKWSTRLQVGADRPTGDLPALLGQDRGYSADLSGSYALGHDFELTGGVRYRLQRDHLLTAADERRDSQAVYVGTAFRF